VSSPIPRGGNGINVQWGIHGHSLRQARSGKLLGRVLNGAGVEGEVISRHIRELVEAKGGSIELIVVFNGSKILDKVFETTIVLGTGVRLVELVHPISEQHSVVALHGNGRSNSDQKGNNDGSSHDFN